MQSQQPLTKVFSIVLIASCRQPAAPAAATCDDLATVANSPPTPLPAPTEGPPPDPIAVVQPGRMPSTRDVDAALSYFTDDGNYLLGYDSTARRTCAGCSIGWPAWKRKRKYPGLPAAGRPPACDLRCLRRLHGCPGARGLPVKAVFTFAMAQDQGSHGVWRRTRMGMPTGRGPVVWERGKASLVLEESAKVVEGTGEGAAVRIASADYQTAMKTQPAATEAAAGALVDAISKGDVDAALAVLAETTRRSAWGTEEHGCGARRAAAMLAWLVGKGRSARMADCEWVGNGIKCELSVSDGCVEAYVARPAACPAR